MKIAFIVTRFPALSETFILNQVTGLLDRGHDVRLFAIKADEPDRRHPDVEKYGLVDRTIYCPDPRGSRTQLLKHFVPPLITSPAMRRLHKLPYQDIGWGKILPISYGHAIAHHGPFDVMAARQSREQFDNSTPYPTLE